MRLVLDEHYSPAVAEQLQQRGYDVMAVAERVDVRQAPLRHPPDEDLLHWAHDENRVLVTENVRDFMPLHHSFVMRDELHAGILFTSPRKFPRRTETIGLLVEALSAYIDQHVASSLRGDIAWL